LWWTNGCSDWSEKEFKKRLRVSKDTFEIILGKIEEFIVKTPTNLNQNPIETDRQLALTLYRLGHGWRPSKISYQKACTSREDE